MSAVRNVLIVGGGTAGWLTACYLARVLNAASPHGIRIVLVESPQVGILGVGEGTFPSIRGTLALIGLDEARFLRGATATFKQGIRFVNWVRPSGAPGRDHYFHPFSLPSQRGDGPELLPYWLLGCAPPGTAFAEAVTMQKSVADAGRGPKRRDDGTYRGRLNYAYHFDAVQFAAVLAEHARSLGVEHRLAHVEDVELDEHGAIARVITREAGAMCADLYIDCTGFRAALIGKALGSPLRSVADTLFADRALTIQVPYTDASAAIASYTIATAHEAGWSWDIGLQARRGTGYVYSSRHCDDARAERVLREHLGGDAEALDARLLRFETGFRPEQWRRNCVAVGLSAGFVEPLESTGIGLIEIAAYLIAHLFPADGDMSHVAAQYNRTMSARFEHIVDFLKMHYCLSRRRDTAFWRDNTDAASIPSSLQERLAMWRCRPPHRLDFVTDLEMFLPASWQYVLYGMEYATDLEPMRGVHTRVREARREFDMLRAVAPHAVADLPDHRALVQDVIERGFERRTAT